MKIEVVRDLPRLGQIYNEIKMLDNFYPNFAYWYFHRFVPDVLLGQSVALTLQNRYNDDVGFALLKNSEEKKLRCLRIKPQYKNRGYAMHLIDESLKILNEDHPLCTVSEEMINEYARIFVNRYDFHLTSVERHLYRCGKNEYIFNEKRSANEMLEIAKIHTSQLFDQ